MKTVMILSKDIMTCLNAAIRHLVALSESKGSDGIGIGKKSQDPLVLSTTHMYVNQT